MDAPTKPNNDYVQGQMMGMLCIIRLLETTKEDNIVIGNMFNKIQRLATASLSGYLDKPEEDVILMVDSLLNEL